MTYTLISILIRLAYREGYKVRFDELQRMIPAMVPKGIPPYSKAAQMVLWQFYANIKVLSSMLMKGKKTGVLRFKPRSRYRSINYNQSGFKFLQGDALKLSKIGKIKCVIHRKIEGVKGSNGEKRSRRQVVCDCHVRSSRRKILLARKEKDSGA